MTTHNPVIDNGDGTHSLYLTIDDLPDTDLDTDDWCDLLDTLVTQHTPHLHGTYEPDPETDTLVITTTTADTAHQLHTLLQPYLTNPDLIPTVTDA